jgi:endoglucanase
MLDNIRWGADYLMACHIEEYQFIAQIGNAGDYYINPDAGTGFWGKPSDMPKNRTATRITLASDGGADAVAAASAALSSTAMVFSSIDRAYAEQALNHAAKLYDFALKMQPVNASYCKVAQCYELSESELKQKVLDDGTNVTKVTEDGRYVKWNAFNSTSAFDDVAWAAAWLYRASRKSSFANDAEFYLRQHWQYEFKWYKKDHWATNWDNVGWATSMMLASELQSDFYRRNVTSFLRGWIRGNVEVSGAEDKAYPITFTKKGLAWQADTPLPNVAMTAMMGLIWAKQPNNGYDARINANIKCWSWGQINYMLGGLMGRDNSYIVNYGKNPPSQPQHMQASCPGNDVCSVRSAFLPARGNPNQLSGALVAGPTANDNYDDVRSSPQSKVGVHFNVPLNGAMAGVMELDLKLTDCQNGRGFYQSFFQPYSP